MPIGIGFLGKLVGTLGVFYSIKTTGGLALYSATLSIKFMTTGLTV
jgi:hypothetical protein